VQQRRLDLAGLRVLGYVDGRNVVFEYRFAVGDYKRQSMLLRRWVIQ
jgi:hypothetical protein